MLMTLSMMMMVYIQNLDDLDGGVHLDDLDDGVHLDDLDGGVHLDNLDDDVHLDVKMRRRTICVIGWQPRASARAGVSTIIIALTITMY